jgi:hypothetical protein
MLLKKTFPERKRKKLRWYCNNTKKLRWYCNNTKKLRWYCNNTKKLRWYYNNNNGHLLALRAQAQEAWPQPGGASQYHSSSNHVFSFSFPEKFFLASFATPTRCPQGQRPYLMVKFLKI